MADPVPMCERCLRPEADCGADQWDNKAVIECRDTEIELLKGKLAAATLVIEAASEMRSWYRKQMGPDGPEVDFDAALAAFTRLSLAPATAVSQGQGETDG